LFYQAVAKMASCRQGLLTQEELAKLKEAVRNIGIAGTLISFSLQEWWALLIILILDANRRNSDLVFHVLVENQLAVTM
jgi:hypothetical protein